MIELGTFDANIDESTRDAYLEMAKLLAGAAESAAVATSSAVCIIVGGPRYSPSSTSRNCYTGYN